MRESSTSCLVSLPLVQDRLCSTNRCLCFSRRIVIDYRLGAVTRIAVFACLAEFACDTSLPVLLRSSRGKKIRGFFARFAEFCHGACQLLGLDPWRRLECRRKECGVTPSGRMECGVTLSG